MTAAVRIPAHSIESLLDENLLAIDRIVHQGGGRALGEMLRSTEADLRKRLEQANRSGLGDRWTGQQLQVTRVLVQQAVRELQVRLTTQLDLFATAAARRGMRDTVRMLKVGERAASGSTHVLALEDALRFDHTLNGVRSSLLRQHATSVDRYGTRMIRQFEQTMQIGMLGHKTTGQMIDDLVGHGGPRGRRVSLAARVLPDGSVERLVETSSKDGLFFDNRYWAERIVRTELQNALNAGAQAAVEEEQAEFPDLKRLLVETFDRRTGEDSVYAHGQIRGVNERFRDGAGREYLHPPGRPNDRGRIVPWREAWGKPKGALAPRPASQRMAALKNTGGSSQGVPPKPAPPPPQPPAPKATPVPTQAQLLAQRGAAVQAVRQQHVPATYEGQFAHLGPAAKSCAWGHAMMERGLDFPIEHVLDVASRVQAGPLSDLHAFVTGLAPNAKGTTLRAIAQQLQNQLEREYIQVAAALLGHLDGISSVALPITVRSTGASALAVQEKRDQVNRFMGLVDRTVPFRPTEVRVPRGNGRAGYIPGYRYAEIAHLRPESTLWHELAHAIEDHDSEALKRAVAFREARTVGEVARRLSVLKPGYNYKPHEIAKADRFPDAYTGRIYQRGGVDWGTEISSTGMTVIGEKWRNGRKDLEHLLFTLGQLGPR